MDKKENQRVMLTKRLVKESLMRLLAHKSIYKLSIRELCEDAGINRSTFYKYYGSQYDVLAEMEDELLSSIETTLQNRNEHGSPGHRQQIEAICAYIENNMDYVQMLLGNNVDPAFPEKLFSLPQIQQIILGQIPARYDDESCDYIFTFIRNGCYHLLQDWIGRKDRKPFGEIANLLEELIEKICR